jgi:acetyl esterase/lipase
MPSLQSHLLRFVLRRVTFLGRSEDSIQDLRRRVDSSARLLRTPRGVAVQRVQAGSVPAEWLIPRGAPADRVLLYLHGGAFVFCSLETHRALVSRLALASGSRALAVDYRLAPEHPFPAALEDCLAAYRWLLQSGIAPRRVVVAGDSAGGNLALVLLLALRAAGDPLPAAAVGLSPVTDLTGAPESRRTKAGVDPILGTGTHLPVSSYVGEQDPRQPLLSPLYADLRGLPPILLHVGTDEILLDDSTRFAERARAAGVDARLVVWPQMWHVFHVFAPFLPEARKAIAQVGEFVREMQG